MCRKCGSPTPSPTSRAKTWMVAIFIIGVISIVAASGATSQKPAQSEHSTTDVDAS